MAGYLQNVYVSYVFLIPLYVYFIRPLHRERRDGMAEKTGDRIPGERKSASGGEEGEMENTGEGG